ncbi:MAG: hypothetical protein ACFFDW_00470 [Candidatus Thorarchaeota archaeon]
MNKKIISTTLMIACVLAVAMIYEPQMGQAAIVKLLMYDQIAPKGDIYQEDIAILGGTIFNNSTDTFRIVQLAADFYHYERNSSGRFEFKDSWDTPTTNEGDPRYIIEPNQARTIYFEHVIDLELNNYTLIIRILYIDVASTTETPNDIQLGNNVSINVKFPRPSTPGYIWAVLVILSLAIIAIIVVGVVGWIRDRKAKK